MHAIDFRLLAPNHPSHHDTHIAQLWHEFYTHPAILQDIKALTWHWHDSDWQTYKHTWQIQQPMTADDKSLTDWLINLFNDLFNHPYHNHIPTILVRGGSEPEYFASKDGQPARIEFAHGFLASSLHEISHWCVAGKKRRQLDDFGYWYCPDGRDESTQKLFEQVEIKPQAIECLLSLALGRYFYVSQDNLNADFDTSNSTFAHDVFVQAKHYLQHPMSLPQDARRLIWLFLHFCFY